MPEAARRNYASRLRQENAEATRRRIVGAATDLMVKDGYSSTTMAGVAERAGVAVPTLYTSCPGGKPGLAKMVYDTALAGDAQAVSQAARPEIQAILDEPDVAAKLALYAQLASVIHQRVQPVLGVLRAAAAASVDQGLEEVVVGIERERLVGSRGPARHLAEFGVLRPGLTADRAAEQIYALTSPEVFDRLTGVCGWSPAQYTDWLARMLVLALLDPAATPSSTQTGDSADGELG